MQRAMPGMSSLLDSTRHLLEELRQDSVSLILSPELCYTKYDLIHLRSFT